MSKLFSFGFLSSCIPLLELRSVLCVQIQEEAAKHQLAVTTGTNEQQCFLTTQAAALSICICIIMHVYIHPGPPYTPQGMCGTI